MGIDKKLTDAQLAKDPLRLYTKDSNGNDVDLDADDSGAVKKALTGLMTTFEAMKSEAKTAREKGETQSASFKEKMAKLEESVSKMQGFKERLDQVEAAGKRNIEMSDGLTIKVGDLDIKLTADQVEYRKQFWDVMLKGNRSKYAGTIDDMAQKALSVNSQENGGILVTPDMSGRIVKKVFESSPMRAVANVAVINATDSLEGLRDIDEFGAVWTGETDPKVLTGNGKIGKWSIPTHELASMPAVTNKLLNDASAFGIGSVEGWIMDHVGRRFGRLENSAFVNGNGECKPKGFLAREAGVGEGQVERIYTGTNGEVTILAVNNLIYALKGAYRNNAVLAGGRLTWGKLRGLEDNEGRPLWQPNIQVGQPATFSGIPTIEFNDMPDPAAGTDSLAIADWDQGYQIVDRLQVEVLRDPLTQKGFVLFFTTKRVGGDVLNEESIKVLNFAPAP